MFGSAAKSLDILSMRIEHEKRHKPGKESTRNNFRKHISSAKPKHNKVQYRIKRSAAKTNRRNDFDNENHRSDSDCDSHKSDPVKNKHCAKRLYARLCSAVGI